MRRQRRVILAAGAIGIPMFAALSAIAQPLPANPPVPPENPITEPKRLLGKMLFWDEQLSADNTMSCGTCHQMNRNGSDPRRVRQSGPDGILNNPDDIIASPGVVRNDALRDYLRDLKFQLAPQVTGRTSMPVVNAAFASELFWDGRAGGEFRDPDTNAVLIAAGGALENQVIGPPLSSVEMGHDLINWSEVTRKLRAARPMALATNLPADVNAALVGVTNYPELFRRAFGDPQVSAARIAMAIATYERTLIANQTPFDLGTMTPNQQLGLQRLQVNNCTACHGGPLFTGNGFRNIGIRPPAEDNGRQGVTGLAADAGRMKVPSLRNVALKNNFMHNGQFTALGQVFAFYDRRAGAPPQFPQNLDPIFNPPGNVRMPPPDGALVADFLNNALVDPRVANQTFPFDRPTLFTERPTDRPVEVAPGTPGSGGIVPRVITLDPAMVGGTDFRIGLDGALPGATARLMLSLSPPTIDRLIDARSFPAQIVQGTGVGNGAATLHWALKEPVVAQGLPFFVQWVVDDPSAVGGQATSPIIRYTPFCGSVGCTPSCVGDYDNNHFVGAADLFAYITAWFSGDIRADVNGVGGVGTQDIFDFLASWFGGC